MIPTDPGGSRMDKTTIDTGCKINLFLRVLGRRADGYHWLETLFLPLREPSDTVTADFAAPPGIALETSGPELGDAKENLAYRAAEASAARAGVAPAWRIRLEKRVPVAAGLGGGSADAAAVLKLLEARYRRLGDGELRIVASRLGADVPFFLDPVPSVGRGVGGELTRLDFALPPLAFVLVDPGFPVSAKWAYRQLAGIPAGGGTLDELLRALRAGDPGAVARAVRNDLAPALWKKFPLLECLRVELTAAGALAVEVSGSGPTLFSLFPGREAAEKAGREMKAKFPSCGVFVVDKI